MLYKTRFKSWRKGTIRWSATGIVYYYNCNNLSRKVQTLCKASAIIFYNNLYLCELFFIHWFFTRIKFPMKYASDLYTLRHTNKENIFDHCARRLSHQRIILTYYISLGTYLIYVYLSSSSHWVFRFFRDWW